MNLQFYKPNSKNSGMAAGFNLSPKDGSLYVNFIRQASWNAETKNGSFKANKDNPDKKKNIKLSPTEAAGIIRAVKTQGKWSSFHTSPNSKTSISFTFVSKNDRSGYFFTVSDAANTDNKFALALSEDEAELLSLYLAGVVAKVFESGSSEAPSGPQSKNDDTDDEPEF